MGSSRLPGKIAQPIGGLPSLVLELRRLASLGLPTIVATSTQDRDDAVAELASAGGADLLRGDETDVLGRFDMVLERSRPGTVIRMTGDCPLADPGVVEAVLSLHHASGAAYTTNVLPRSYPKGLDVEVMAADALAEAVAEAVDPTEREHVTPFLYRRPERYALANLLGPLDLGEERWTLDTPSDLERLRTIAEAVDDPVTATFDELLEAAGVWVVGRAGRLHLRPVTPTDVARRPALPTQSAPGDCPWRRAWIAEIDGEAVGSVVVDVGHGVVERTLDVPDDLRSTARSALDALLEADEQIRV